MNKMKSNMHIVLLMFILLISPPVSFAGKDELLLDFGLMFDGKKTLIGAHEKYEEYFNGHRRAQKKYEKYTDNYKKGELSEDDYAIYKRAYDIKCIEYNRNVDLFRKIVKVFLLEMFGLQDENIFLPDPGSDYESDSYSGSESEEQCFLPDDEILRMVESKHMEHLKRYAEGTLHYIYYTNLYRKIVREFDVDVEGLRDGLSDLEIMESSKVRRPRKRLFLGEGSFSFAVAFLLKHPEMVPYIVATEYDSLETAREKHGEEFERNYRFLQSLNVDVRFGVDATNLDETFTERFKRIHFNFPYFGKRPGERYTRDEDNRDLVAKFFLSVGNLQQFGDRVYVALPKPPKSWERKRRQGLVYAIYSACTKAGYQYVAKRPFSKKREEDVWQRYSGYKHVMTSGYGGADVADNSREYIFEKVDRLIPKLDLEEVNILGERLRNLNRIEEFEEAIRNAGLHKNRVASLIRKLNLQETLTARVRSIIDYICGRIKIVRKSDKYDKKAKSRIIKKYEDLKTRVIKILNKINRDYDQVEEEHKFILDLVRDLSSYSSDSRLGFRSKIFFAEDVPISTDREGLKEVSFQYVQGDSEERRISLEDALDFLFSEKLVIYYHTYGDLYDSAFYPLPILDTDEESSDYSSDSDTYTGIDFGASELESRFEEMSLERVKKESLKMAQDSGRIGPRIIDGWALHDVKGDGNCLYRAFAHQLKLVRHPIIHELPYRTKLHDLLRLRSQREGFEDRSWAGYSDIMELARKLRVIVAIADTRYPQDGFVYHYINENGNAEYTTSISSIREIGVRNRHVIRLAFTGDHYLSVSATRTDMLEQSLYMLDSGSPFFSQDGLRSRSRVGYDADRGLFVPFFAISQFSSF